jgi:hypothetical protein
MLFRTLFLLLAALALAACNGQAKEPTVGVMLTGLDHLPEHLSIQDFSVNGVSGHQAGKGGRQVCCISLPAHWHPGIRLHVAWAVTNWRDKVYSLHETDVELERYAEVGDLFVHFLPDGSVRALSSLEYPESPTYAGPPYSSVPRKEPWNKYPSDGKGNARLVKNAMEDHRQ